MADEQSQSQGAPQRLEAIVVEALKGAVKSREGWEAQRSEDEPPMSDFQVFLENMIAEVKRHGLVVTKIAMAPRTRTDLEKRMPGAIDRIPVWMDAKIYGPPLMTPRLFVHGLAQLMGEHRTAIEQVVEDQVADREEIEETLAAAPIPQGDDEESDAELIGGAGAAMVAHVQALIDIARDFDNQVAALLDLPEPR